MLQRVSQRFAQLQVMMGLCLLVPFARGNLLYHLPFRGETVDEALGNQGAIDGAAQLDLRGPRDQVLPAPVLVTQTPWRGRALQLPVERQRGVSLILPDSDGRLDLAKTGVGMTFAAWIKLAPAEEPTVERTILAQDGWPEAGWQIGLSPKRNLRFIFRPAHKPERLWLRKTKRTLPVDEWVHVAAVVRTEADYGEGIRFYINGEEAEPDMDITGNPVAVARGPLLLGAAHRNNGAPLNGMMGDLRLYSEPMPGPKLFRGIDTVDSPLQDFPMIPEPWEPESTADLSPYLPFDMPPCEELAASEKKVFGNWHVFKISEDNRPAWDDAYMRKWLKIYPGRQRAMRQRPLPRPVRETEDWRVRDMMLEVRLAKAIGCDGFIMNHFGHRDTRHIEDMLEAAKRVDSPFKIMLARDVVGWANYPRRMRERHGDAVSYYTRLYTRFGKHPFAYRYNGELVISGFMAEGLAPGQWTAIFDNLRAEGIETYFAPYFLNWGKHYEAYASVADMMGYWGPTGYQAYKGQGGHAAQAQRLGTRFFAPVRPQYIRYGVKHFSESKGSAMLRYAWLRAIHEDADWANLATWNDYTEASEVAPGTGTQYAVYDLNAYYIVWFKTGKRPEILRDVLYYFHRTQFTDAEPTEGPQFQAKRSKAVDVIELLAFLKEPGTLTIEIGDKTHTLQAPAGITPFYAPLDYGTPRFKLLRDGEPVIDMQSAFTVMDKPVRAHDPLYKGGSSTRPVVPMHDLYKRYFEDVDRP